MQAPAEATNPDLGTWLERILPILRVKQEAGFLGIGSFQRVVALFKDKVVLGRTHEPFPVADASLTPDNLEEELRLRLRGHREIPLVSVTSVVVEMPVMGQKICRFRLISPAGTFRFVTLRREEENFSLGLQGLLGDRVILERRVRFHNWGALALLVMLAIAVGLAWVYYPTLPGGAAFLGLIVMCACLPSFLLLTYMVLELVPGRPPLEKQAVPKPRLQIDKSHRTPFRSPVLGWTIKILAGVWVLTSFCCYPQLGLLILAHRLGLNLGSVGGIVLTFAVTYLSPFLGLLCLYWGYQLSQTRPEYIRKRDARRPILFLRSFLDDRKTDLNSSSTLAYLLGVKASYTFPAPWKYLFRIHPIRIIRVMFGSVDDTTEEQLGRYFCKRGPFVAIGKPGERFATPGASRIYVSDESWRKTVEELLVESQVVVLQPAKTEGIWWEIQKAAALIEPQRLLLCLVNFSRRQDDYEAFRLKAEEYLPCPLPRWLGCTAAVCFMYFDRDWTPRVQILDHLNAMAWPWVGSTADLNYTLQPFIQGLESDASQPPAPLKKHREVAVAFCLYIIFPFLYFWYMGIARPNLPAKISPASRDPIFLPDGKTTYTGRVLPYRITLDRPWVQRPEGKNADLHFVASDQGELIVLAGKAQQDLSDFPDQFVDALRKETKASVVLLRNQSVQVRAKPWTDLLLEIKVPNQPLHVHVRTYSGYEGTFILRLTSLASDKQFGDSAAQAMDSFQLPSPP
jgi:hypothetical protein